MPFDIRQGSFGPIKGDARVIFALEMLVLLLHDQIKRSTCGMCVYLPLSATLKRGYITE